MRPATPTQDLTDLRAAFEAERGAVERLHQTRDHVADAVIQALSQGVTYDRLACISLRARTGRPPTLEDRKREAQRLRQYRRRRVTSRHGNDVPATATTIQERDHELRFSPKEKAHMNDTLIKRTTTTEEFVRHDETDADDDFDGTDDDTAGPGSERDEPANKRGQRR